MRSRFWVARSRQAVIVPISSVSPAGTADQDGGGLRKPVRNPKSDTLLASADADDDVHALGHHPVRQRRQAVDLDAGGVDIGELAGVDVVEVMVR